MVGNPTRRSPRTNNSENKYKITPMESSLAMALSPRRRRVQRISGLRTDSTTGSVDPGSGSIGSTQDLTTDRPRRGRGRTWTETENETALRCYELSRPNERGYRKRMLSEWSKIGTRQVTEQQLAGQVRQLLRSNRNRIQTEPEQVEPEQTDEVFLPSNNTESSSSCETRERIEAKFNEQNRPRLVIPRKISKGKLRDAVRKIDMVLHEIRTGNLTELNQLIHAAAQVVLEDVGLRLRQETEQARRPRAPEPPWQLRIENKIKRIRRQLNQLNSSKRFPKLEQRLRIGPGKNKEEAIEELKQRLVAEAAKLKRLKDRAAQFRDNCEFNQNEGQFYRRLQGETPRITPSNEQIDFWEGIWGVEGPEAEPLGRVTPKQTDQAITLTKLEAALRKMRNWKAPGIDGIHGYWLKNFRSLHKRLVDGLNEAVSDGCPEWMTTGKTCLLPKDKPGDTRPITCLTTTWKLLTSIIARDIGAYLEGNSLIPDEQKGCRTKTRGCKDQLLIDQAIMKNCRRRCTNMTVTWVDFRKAYDSVSHSWLLEAMRSVGVSDQWLEFLSREMPNWQTRIGNRTIKFLRGLFQGDSLAPLMFVISLIPITKALNESGIGYSLGRGQRSISHLWFMDDCKLYSRDPGQQQKQVELLEREVRKTGMEFGVSKCGSLVLKRGRIADSQSNPVVASGETIPTVNEGYKYLGITQTDLVHHVEMKVRLTKEYKSRVRKILKKTRLNAANTIKAINTWAVSVVRYSAGIVKWTIEEMRQLDRDTRKLLAAERVFNLNGDVDRLYIPRAEGGKGLISIEECITIEDTGLREYIHRLPLEAIASEAQAISSPPDTSSRVRKKEMLAARKAKYDAKTMHGQFERETAQVRDKEATFRWLRYSHLKRETEALIMAAQEQSLRTRSIKCHIDKTSQTDRCRMCHNASETSEHLVSACPKLAQREYKRRHDKVAALVHWNLLRHHGIPSCKHWYEHQPERVTETNNCKILWDFNVQTDKIIDARRPDIIRIDKDKRTAQIIDIAVPIDRNVTVKEIEKVEKYQELAIEVRRLWKLTKVEVVPVVIGALGTVPMGLKDSLGRLGIEYKSAQDIIQKSTLLGTARILRRVLSLPGDGTEARG